MAINITIGSKEEKPARTKAKMNIRKSVDGNLMICDHDMIDIIIIPEKSKVLVVAKEMMDDNIYDVQNRFFRNLTRKGVISLGSVRAGNVYGSMEAKIPEGKDGINSIDMALLVTSRWMADEMPHIIYKEKMEDEFVDDLTDPEDDETTELGKIEHPTKTVHQPSRSTRGAQFPFTENKENK